MDHAEAFRRAALAMPHAQEGSHMGSADFRVNNHIFATLAYIAKGLGTLKLTTQQQQEYLADGSEYFQPAPGGWGRMGMTLIRLDAPDDVLVGALTAAYRNVAGKAPVRKKRLESRL